MTRKIIYSTDIVSGMSYPPDFFLKRAIQGVKSTGTKIAEKTGLKKLGDRIADTKVGGFVADGLKFSQNVRTSPLTVLTKGAEPLHKKEAFRNEKLGKASEVTSKVAGTAALAVTGGALAGGAIKGAGAAKGANIAKTLRPKPVDIVSSVAGAKGTPKVINLAGSGIDAAKPLSLKDRVLKAVERIPAPVKEKIREKGNKAIEQGIARLTPQQEVIEEMRTTPEMLPKTRELRQAEDVILSPAASVATVSESKLSLKNPLVIGGIILAVILIAYFAFKE